MAEEEARYRRYVEEAKRRQAALALYQQQQQQAAANMAHYQQQQAASMAQYQQLQGGGGGIWSDRRGGVWSLPGDGSQPRALPLQPAASAFATDVWWGRGVCTCAGAARAAWWWGRGIRPCAGAAALNADRAQWPCAGRSAGSLQTGAASQLWCQSLNAAGTSKSSTCWWPASPPRHCTAAARRRQPIFPGGNHWPWRFSGGITCPGAFRLCLVKIQPSSGSANAKQYLIKKCWYPNATVCLLFTPTLSGGVLNLHPSRGRH